MKGSPDFGNGPFEISLLFPNILCIRSGKSPSLPSSILNLSLLRIYDDISGAFFGFVS